jgi:hypothetical protein
MRNRASGPFCDGLAEPNNAATFGDGLPSRNNEDLFVAGPRSRE